MSWLEPCEQTQGAVSEAGLGTVGVGESCQVAAAIGVEIGQEKAGFVMEQELDLWTDRPRQRETTGTIEQFEQAARLGLTEDQVVDAIAVEVADGRRISQQMVPPTRLGPSSCTAFSAGGALRSRSASSNRYARPSKQLAAIRPDSLTATSHSGTGKLMVCTAPVSTSSSYNTQALSSAGSLDWPASPRLVQW